MDINVHRMICENCEKEYEEKYASGRFCSLHCSRSYVSKKYANTKEARKLKSISLKGRQITWLTPEIRKKQGKSLSTNNTLRRRIKNNLILTGDWFTLKNDSQRKLRVFYDQNFRCNCCKINKWMNKKITFELHHKDGDRKNTLRTNLEVLCPNCHTQTPNYRWSRYAPIKSKIKVSMNLPNHH